MARINPYKVGGKDKQGRTIVQVSPEGWYKCADGSIRDENGYEWYADAKNGAGVIETPQTRIAPDGQYGNQVLIRDFKIVMNPALKVDPKTFIEHWRPTIEATMVETGWDYADVEKPIEFGEATDGYAHIYVKMKKKAWNNRENMYAGVASGRDMVKKSQALIKVGAVDPIIHGAVETERSAQEIVTDHKSMNGRAPK